MGTGIGMATEDDRGLKINQKPRLVRQTCIEHGAMLYRFECIHKRRDYNTC